MLKYCCLLLLAFFISACAVDTELSCRTLPAGDKVYIFGDNWHTGIAIPVDKLGKDLAFYKKAFPGARTILFGYGKETFFTAPPQAFSEYILGPVPGPAVIQAIGLKTTLVEAYPPKNTLTLTLPPGGSKALSHYIWNDLAKNEKGKPQIVAPSHDPDGLFYAASSEYNLFHTCNAWTANALHEAGLPVSGDGVVFSVQIMDQVTDAAENQCESLR